MSEKKSLNQTDRLHKDVLQLREQVETQRKQLIEQEHRTISVITNLFNSFTADEFKTNRKESIKAAATLVARWYFRRTLVVSTVGIVGLLGGIFTLWFTYQQTGAIIDQNKLFTSQNELFQQQMIDQQRSTNAQILSELLADIQLSRNNIPVDSSGYRQLNKLLLYRIYSASNAFKPYGEAYSLERGVLLRALVEAKVKFPLSPNPNFEKANLNYVSDLRGANLEGAYLKGASFYRADLRSANLKEANLKHAYLAESILINANFSSAELDSSILIAAGMNNAIFAWAHFSNANLVGADMFESNFESANFRSAELSFATIYDSNLNYADFRSSNLMNTTLMRCDLSNAKFSEANLQNANFKEANLFSAELAGSKRLNTKQLSHVQTLYNASLDSLILDSLRVLDSTLFQFPDLNLK